jgi:hypothetical protein
MLFNILHFSSTASTPHFFKQTPTLAGGVAGTESRTITGTAATHQKSTSVPVVSRVLASATSMSAIATAVFRSGCPTRAF